MFIPQTIVTTDIILWFQVSPNMEDVPLSTRVLLIFGLVANCYKNWYKIVAMTGPKPWILSWKGEPPLRKNQEDLSVGIQLVLTTVILFSVLFDVHPTNLNDHIVHWFSTVWFAVSPNMEDYSTMFQVAGVVGRAETLSALFFLLTLFCYRRAAHDNKGSRNIRFMCLFVSVSRIRGCKHFNCWVK